MAFITMKTTKKADISLISESLILLKAKPTNDINNKNNKTLVSKERPHKNEKLKKMTSFVVPEREWMKDFFGM